MIDWDRIRELRSEIGADDFLEVAAMFLEEADEAVARLIGIQVAKSLEADLHFLKGAALNLGFVRLSSLCQDGERRASAGDTTVNIFELSEAYNASKQAFLSQMDAAFAA